MNKGYVCIIAYDLPVTGKFDVKKYRIFRKELSNSGYYQLQESIYCYRFNERVQAENSIEKLKKVSPKKGDIRGLILTINTFDKMFIIQGEQSITEKIILGKEKIVEF